MSYVCDSLNRSVQSRCLPFQVAVIPFGDKYAVSCSMTRVGSSSSSIRMVEPFSPPTDLVLLDGGFDHALDKMITRANLAQQMGYK